jgi:hypothetical protein
MPFGSQSIVLCDVKAAIHFFSRDTFTYQQTKLSANFIKNMASGFISALRICRELITKYSLAKAFYGLKRIIIRGALDSDPLHQDFVSCKR